MGDGRARTLLCLDTARSTSEVAAECDLAIATASHHLAALRAAALTTSRRTGHQVGLDPGIRALLPGAGPGLPGRG